MSSKDLEAKGDGAGYILVDFDRTLAHYSGWDNQKNEIGDPIPAMVERVIRWLKSGQEVRIFTARASTGRVQDIEPILGFCQKNFGRELRVQNWKDFHCVAIWDDLAISVEPNTGMRMCIDPEQDPLNDREEDELVSLSPLLLAEDANEDIYGTPV